MSERTRSPLALLGGLLALYLLAPIAAFVLRATHGAPAEPGLAGALGTSLLTATIATALIALCGIPLAWLLARSRSPAAGALSVLVALPLALPPLMSGVLLIYLVGPETLLGRLFGGALTDTMAGVVIAQTFVAAPFLIVAARASFVAVDPGLEEVAQTLGHGPVARFVRVALPAAWPGVRAGLLLAWLRAFGEFGATVIVAYHPYTLPVFTFVQFDGSGLPGTVLPLVAALVTALGLLSAIHLLSGRLLLSRRKVHLPQTQAAPTRAGSRHLHFSLRKRLGELELHIDHAGSAGRLALLGPSGAGKTLSLRLIAGLTEAHSSRISLGERQLGDLPVQRRSIGYVPQESALLPGQTVWRQVLLGVGAVPERAAWWLERLGLSGLEGRLPNELSGGQRRRVALARALASDPDLLLLDEPFSALDAPVRRQLYRDLRALQREAALASVLVTHDPEEAALLADELIVIDRGKVLQQGSTTSLFARPASPRVAELLGVANVFNGIVAGPDLLRAGTVQVTARTGSLPRELAVCWRIAPEAIIVATEGPHEAQLMDLVPLGSHFEATLRLGELELSAHLEQLDGLQVGASCRLHLPIEKLHVWPSGRSGWLPEG